MTDVYLSDEYMEQYGDIEIAVERCRILFGRSLLKSLDEQIAREFHDVTSLGERETSGITPTQWEALQKAVKRCKDGARR